MRDGEQFCRYLRVVAGARLEDRASSFERDLRGLAATGMATEFLERLLNAVPEPKDWEIGEALAECALRDDSGRDVHWPWNTVRDRRTPRASLPGADLVGFRRDGDSVLLLFGEVKTSSDASAPPGVMNGGSGMTWQLERNATRLDVQHALLRWLHARCREEPYRGFYEDAVSRYLASQGSEFVLVGVLIRDTSPDERDVKRRAESLRARLNQQTRVELLAWYLPIRIAEWVGLLRREEG